MLGRDQPNVWAYDRYTTNALSPQYYSTSSGSMRFLFSKNLKDYYHEFHGIGNSFHDHILVYVHGFGAISHSLQRMVRIQLDETGDFSSKAHYFAQQQRDIISI